MIDRACRAHLIQWVKPNLARTVLETLWTFSAIILLWLLAYKLLKISYLMAFLIAVINSIFFVRVFLLQHDFGHQALFKSKFWNCWVGRICSLFTHIPFDFWDKTHKIHHATSGNLDKRGLGDIDLLTVSEYKKLGYWGKLKYRILRNTFVLLCLESVLYFFVRLRLHWIFDKHVRQLITDGKIASISQKDIISVYALNIILIIAYIIIVNTMGWMMVALMGATFFCSSFIGVFLFYVQHNYENTTFSHQDEWDSIDSAVKGSSFFKLPRLFSYLTCHIGYHHIHHLIARIPFYHLPKAHQALLNLDPTAEEQITKLSILSAMKCFKFKLYDVEKQCMVGWV